MNEFKIIQRKKGFVLLFEGRRYYKHKTYKNQSSIWSCGEKRKGKCGGSLTLNDKIDSIVKSSPHVCTPKILQNEVDVAINEIKEEAKSTDRPMPQLYEEANIKWQEQGLNLIRPFPNFENSKHCLYDARNKNAGVSKLTFQNLSEFQVPLQYTKNVIADYYDGHTKIIVFCMEEDPSIIRDVKEAFGDATFQCTPAPFAELFIIHGEFGSTATTTYVKPIFYALMSNKDSATYAILFHLLKSQLPDWQPQIYHCDFELAALNGIVEVYPDLKIVGCYYHWSQAMRRNGKKIFGPKKSKPENRLIGLCSVLPLLPKTKIESGWEYIKMQFIDNESRKIRKFIKYVEKQWMSRDITRILSVFGNRHRTNNVCESWHSKINKSLNKRNTNILRLLNEIKKLHKFKNCKKERSRTKRAIENDEYIQSISMELVTGEINVDLALEKLRY